MSSYTKTCDWHCFVISILCAGYVLSCLPFLSDDHQSVHKQLELVQNLKLPPDFIINIKVFLFKAEHWLFLTHFYTSSLFFSSSVRIAIWSRGCRVWGRTQKLDSHSAGTSGSVRRRSMAGRRRGRWRVMKSRSGLDHTFKRELLPLIGMNNMLKHKTVFNF